MNKALMLAKELGVQVESVLRTYSYLCEHKELIENNDIWKTVERLIRNTNSKCIY